MMTARRTDESFLADAATQVWTERLARAGTASPVDIDDLLVDANPMATHRIGAAVFARTGSVVLPRDDPAGGRPAIGVLLNDAQERIEDGQTPLLATRYAALAVEKECDVIILSHQNNSGFERFGFRVERLSGATEEERADCLDQLRRFWGLELII